MLPWMPWLLYEMPPNGGFFPVVLSYLLMIALPSKQETKSPSYPPVDDFINLVSKIDWSDLGKRVRQGTSAVLLFAMKFSEKSYDFHEYLYTRLNDMK